jgi:crossover junction endodeoxyribonuclease RuvC
MATATPGRIGAARPGRLGSRGPGSCAIVLGIDPGLRRTGYAALQAAGRRPSLREAGVIDTAPDQGLGARLHSLHGDIAALLDELRPDLVVLEDLFVHRAFPRTAIVLGHARGIIYLAAAAQRVSVLEIAPSAVKQAVVGSGRASKGQVQAAVRTLLGLRGLADTHAADALALAYAGLARLGAVRS